MESREDVAAMLKEDALIDLIIPRGSNAFVRYIMDNSRIPVLGHSDGVCHVYLDAACDPTMAARVTVDAKTQYPAACTAAEWLPESVPVMVTANTSSASPKAVSHSCTFGQEEPLGPPSRRSASTIAATSSSGVSAYFACRVMIFIGTQA